MSHTRPLVRLAGAGVAALAILPVGMSTAASSATAATSPTKYYSIANSKQLNSGAVLTASSSAAGSAVTLSTYTGSSRQHWYWKDAPGTGMHLINRSTGLCLHADFVGASLKQQSCTNTEQQKWLWGFFGGTRRLTQVPSIDIGPRPAVSAGSPSPRLMPFAGFDDFDQAFLGTFRGTL